MHTHTHHYLWSISMPRLNRFNQRTAFVFFPICCFIFLLSPSHTHTHTLSFLSWNQITSVWMFPRLSQWNQTQTFNWTTHTESETEARELLSMCGRDSVYVYIYITLRRCMCCGAGDRRSELQLFNRCPSLKIYYTLCTNHTRPHTQFLLQLSELSINYTCSHELNGFICKVNPHIICK